MKHLFIYLLFGVIFLSAQIHSQNVRHYESGYIYESMKKLQVLGSVLYIAAHPDDENTAVISYMANHKKVRVAYLSLTRGSGGQNLIGPEKGHLLGVLRTQELLEARKIDGGDQFFTRAVDFGYSKRIDETLEFWNKDSILYDIVWIIRYYRPDIIITRFTPEKGGHGHHRASAVLAIEAFHAAGDADRFPDQLEKLEPWQAARILWNAWNPQLKKRDPQSDPLVKLDLGTYSPVYGQSYTEIAAKSRSMHKSQGFGWTPVRGRYLNYFEHIAGDPAHNDIFDDMDLSWNRVPGGAAISQKIAVIISNYNFNNPAASIAQLVDLYKLMDIMPDTFWIKIKKQEVRRLIKLCAGIWIEAITDKHYLIPGDSLKIDSKIIVRSDIPVDLAKIEINDLTAAEFNDLQLQKNTPFGFTNRLMVPENNISKLLSRDKVNANKNYSIESQPFLKTVYYLDINGMIFAYETAVKYHWTDPVLGERYREVIPGPPVFVEFMEPVYMFPNGEPKDIEINVTCMADTFAGLLKLDMPDGWKSKPAFRPLDFKQRNQVQIFKFKIIPHLNSASADIRVQVQSGNSEYNLSRYEINYDHIQPQTVFHIAKTRFVSFKIKTSDKKIAYIMGSGDDIPASLGQIGYEIKVLSDEEIQQSDFSEFDAVLCGIRAFNTREILHKVKFKLNKYVKNGGTWIVQHNTRFGLKADEIGPYHFDIGRARISEENADLLFIEPDHKLLNYPNRISTADFENWIQERGLYFAHNWDEQYVPLLSGHDKGEMPHRGAVIYAEYGKGHFIYSGLSFFRQLPAGVPGAYRLLVNMISVGN